VDRVFDVRVQERNLRAGTITDQDISNYVSALPDLVAQSTSFATPQPALDLPPVSTESSASEADDDDDDSNDDSDSEAGE